MKSQRQQIHLFPSDCGLLRHVTAALHTSITSILRVFEQVFELVPPFGSSEILDVRFDSILIIVSNFGDDRSARCSTYHLHFDTSPWRMHETYLPSRWYERCFLSRIVKAGF